MWTLTRREELYLEFFSPWWDDLTTGVDLNWLHSWTGANILWTMTIKMATNKEHTQKKPTSKRRYRDMTNKTKLNTNKRKTILNRKIHQQWVFLNTTLKWRMVEALCARTAITLTTQTRQLVAIGKIDVPMAAVTRE
jgi:hypothetical protein